MGGRLLLSLMLGVLCGYTAGLVSTWYRLDPVLPIAIFLYGASVLALVGSAFGWMLRRGSGRSRAGGLMC